MANLSITATEVIGTPASASAYNAGEAIAAGTPVYVSAGTAYKADSNDTAAKAIVVGLALNSTSAANQPIKVQRTGTVTVGASAAPTKGVVYMLSETAGVMQPTTDLGAGEYRTIIGIATSTSAIALCIYASGVTDA